MFRNTYLPMLAFMVAVFHLHPALAAQCEFSVVNEWNSGFTGSIKISNDTDQSIDGWSVELTFPGGETVGNTWNANVSGSAPYTFTNKSYNAVIRANSEISFGFNGSKPSNGAAVSLPILSGLCESDNSARLPVANLSLSPATGTVPLSVQFDGTASSDPTGKPLTYLWDFGDGTSSEQISPEKIYQNPGVYSVSLTVNNGEQDSTTVTETVQALSPQPTSAQCQFDVVNEWNSGFTASLTISNDAQTDIDGWAVALTFSDGTTITGAWNAKMTGENPYQLNNANYNSTIPAGGSVKLGFNAQKAVAGATAQTPLLAGICGNIVTPNQPPTAVAQASSLRGAPPFTIDFDGSESSDPDNDSLTYYWDFGDGSESTEASPSKSFDQTGTYTVTLTVNDGQLDSAPDSLTIQVIESDTLPSYVLDPQMSSIYFVSSKKVHVLETHSFNDISGLISATGEANLSINLDSVETGIDIRNQRMREFLFETTLYTTAQVTLSLDPDQIASLALGSVTYLEISPTLDLHGVSLPLTATVRISKLSDSQLIVQNVSPVVINAEDFDLITGIETLRDLAGLSVISYQVPVNFTLVFNTQ